MTLVHAIWCMLMRSMKRGCIDAMAAQAETMKPPDPPIRYDKEEVKKQLKELNQKLIVLDREARLIRGEYR